MLYTRVHEDSADASVKHVLWDEIYVIQDGSRMLEVKEKKGGEKAEPRPRHSIMGARLTDGLTPLTRLQRHLQTVGVKARAARHARRSRSPPTPPPTRALACLAGASR